MALAKPTPATISCRLRGGVEPLTRATTAGDCISRGIDGTEHLTSPEGRIDIRLTILGNADHRVLLNYCGMGWRARLLLEGQTSKTAAGMGRYRARRHHADRIVHSVRKRLDRGQGIHGAGRCASREHRLGCRRRSSGRRVSRSISASRCGQMMVPCCQADGSFSRRALIAASEPSRSSARFARFS